MYRWTPDVVARLPLEYLIWLPLLEQADARAQERHQKARERDQAARARQRGGV